MSIVCAKGGSRQDVHHLCPSVLPPHGALQAAGVPLEAERLRLEVVGRLHEQLDALSPLQDLRAVNRVKLCATVCAQRRPSMPPGHQHIRAAQSAAHIGSLPVHKCHGRPIKTPLAGQCLGANLLDVLDHDALDVCHGAADAVDGVRARIVIPVVHAFRQHLHGCDDQ